MAGSNNPITEQEVLSGDDPGVLTTKITIPSRRMAAITRPRLINRLQQSKSRTCLTIIAAPAGFGKTTLARQWALSSGSLVAWLSLDVTENEPLRFLTYVTMAIRRVLPTFGAGVLALVRSSQPPSAAIVGTALLNALQDCPEPLVLILDDYHLIVEKGVHDLVTLLLDHLPAPVHLVLASRTDPPLPLSRLRARGEMTEIRAADLRCAGNEVSAFFQEIMGISLGPEQLAALGQRTEGWLAGLQLAALSLQHSQDPENFIAAFTGSNRYIVDYLGEEVLRNQPEEMRRFLYATAILERLHGPLCEAVVGNLVPGDGQRLLEQMESANLFLVALDDCRRWYRYHHLFGDMLRARLLQEAERDLPELHRRAMLWYEANGLHQEAIPHALNGGWFDDAVRLIQTVIEPMWRTGDGFTPRRWLAQLPGDYLRKSPTLLLFQARYHVVAAEPEKMTPLLDELESLLHQLPYSASLWGEYTALRAFEATFYAKDQRAIELAEEALRILPSENRLWTAIMQLLLSTIHAERGESQQALTLCSQAAAECERCGDFHTTLIARTIEGGLREANGCLSEAEKIYQDALDFARRLGTGGLSTSAGVLSGLGSVALERNDLSRARSLILKARQAAWEFDASDARLRTAYLHLLLCLTEKDIAGASTVLEDLTVFARSRAYLHISATVDAFRAAYNREVGDREAVDHWLQRMRTQTGVIDDLALLRALRMQSGPPSLNVGTIMAMVLLRYRFDQKDFPAVTALASDLYTCLETQGQFGAALPVRLLLACVAQEQEDLSHALALLSPALTFSRRESYKRPFLTTGFTIVPLLKRAIQQGIEPEYARQLLLLFAQPSANEYPPAPLAPPSANPPPTSDALTEREIEVLRLVAAGLSNQEIAERLFLSVGTVKRHLHNIFGKLDADNRVTALTRARTLGIDC